MHAHNAVWSGPTHYFLERATYAVGEIKFYENFTPIQRTGYWQKFYPANFLPYTVQVFWTICKWRHNFCCNTDVSIYGTRTFYQTYAQYPSHGIAADYLFPIAWEVVKHLECADFKVISLTGDKASPNRKLIRMHRLGTVQKFDTTYKNRNPYSIEERYIYFISDVPYLIINILRSLCSACYYFQYWQEIPPCFDFYVITRSYSSRPFLCTLGMWYTQLHACCTVGDFV